MPLFWSCLPSRPPITCIRVRIRSRGAHTTEEIAPDPIPAIPFIREDVLVIFSAALFFRLVANELDGSIVPSERFDIVLPSNFMFDAFILMVFPLPSTILSNCRSVISNSSINTFHLQFSQRTAHLEIIS